MLGVLCVLSVGAALLWRMRAAADRPTAPPTRGRHRHNNDSARRNLSVTGNAPCPLAPQQLLHGATSTTCSAIPADLNGHIDTHGPLAVFLGNDRSWQLALASSLESSGLAGRGGGGFPASIKLALASSHGPGGVVVVNGMEGEPASDKDKLLLTRAPHLVLDGAQFLAAMCRSSRIVVCIPAGRDGIAAAVNQAIGERQRADTAEWPKRSSDRPTASSPARSRRW